MRSRFRSRLSDFLGKMQSGELKSTTEDESESLCVPPARVGCKEATGWFDLNMLRWFVMVSVRESAWKKNKGRAVGYATVWYGDDKLRSRDGGSGGAADIGGCAELDDSTVLLWLGLRMLL